MVKVKPAKTQTASMLSGHPVVQIGQYALRHLHAGVCDRRCARLTPRRRGASLVRAADFIPTTTSNSHPSHRGQLCGSVRPAHPRILLFESRNIIYARDVELTLLRYRHKRTAEPLRRSTFGVPQDSSDEDSDASDTETSVTDTSSEASFSYESDTEETKPQLLSISYSHAIAC